MFTSFTDRARATIVIAGIAVALAAGLAPGALAKTKPGTADDGSTGVVAASLALTAHHGNGHHPDPAAPPALPPTSAPTAPTGGDPAAGDPAAPPTSPSAAPPSSAPARPPAISAPAAPPATPPTSASAPATGGPAAPTTSAPAAPPPPAVHKGVIIATPAPHPATAAEATDLLAEMATTITVKSKSVTTIVWVPAGVFAAGGDEVSILFGLGPRQTQSYDPLRGNTFRFDFPAGDGSLRQENVAISLADFGAGGHYGFVRQVPVEAHYNATVSPLRFTLINDCDFNFANLFSSTNEVKISWSDERGDARQEFLMGAGQTKTVDAFAHTVTDVTAHDGLQLPYVGFEELDAELPLPPYHFPDPVAAKPQPPLLPDSRTVQFTSHSPGDEFCNGNFIYATTVTLMTYDTL